MSYERCFGRLRELAGRPLTDNEINAIFERVHKAALDIKAGRAKEGEPKLRRGLAKAVEVKGTEVTNVLERAAVLAAEELRAEAALAERQANLQVLTRASLNTAYRSLVSSGLSPLDAVGVLIRRDYKGRVNVSSLEQQAEGHRDYYLSRLQPAWDALGPDFAGFWQDKAKMRDLIRELRGEDTGNALAKQGAKAFHDVAEEARTVFNEKGGNVGRLEDWGHPQHHSQELVARAGYDRWLQTLDPAERAAARVTGAPPPAAFARDFWIDSILPLLDRNRYVDDLGTAMSDAELRAFLGKAWDNIVTDGLASQEPGAFTGIGKRANRHSEHRQIHFKDADSTIQYWETFGDRSVFEILHGHVSTMARDIAFIETFGPNPNVNFRTLRDEALQESVVKEPALKGKFDKQAGRLERLWDYASGRTKAPANIWFSGIADALFNLNVAGKLHSAAITSLFGDKVMLEAVSTMDNLPAYRRWMTEMSVLDPTNEGDHRMLQRQGLMLDTVRSAMYRFGDDLGRTRSVTGKTANAVMRLTGMQLVNEGRKAGFGAMLMSSIGHELGKGVRFEQLPESDVRTLRYFGVTRADWETWRLAKLEEMDLRYTTIPHALTPSAIRAIPDDAIVKAGLVDPGRTPADVRRDAIVKLLGAVNTESEFAIVTPGWEERSLFYGSVQRGTIPGEITRSVLQFKSFPWAFFQRGMDAVANQDGMGSKAAMTAYLLVATTLMGAMILQTKDILTGKDPRKMTDENALKFWANAFIAGGALGIYGDFFYGVTHTRYGSGPVEALAGPTIGPLLEMGLLQPLKAIERQMAGKETHLAAQEVQDIKGFVPNLWYTKAAMDHLVWNRVLDALSPGYVNHVRQNLQRNWHQDYYWPPEKLTPERLPNMGAAIGR